MKALRWILWIAAGLFLTAGSCATVVYLALRGEPLPTVDGPESPALLARLEGTLVLSDGRRGLRLVTLPGRSEERLELAARPGHFSAIDAQDRIAYWTSTRDSHQVRIRRVDHRDEQVVVDRPGELNMQSRIALSSDTGLVAFLYCIHEGAFRYTPWTLEVLEVQGPTLLTAEAASSHGGPRWFADGRRVAFQAPDGVHVVDVDHPEGALSPARGDPCIGPRQSLATYDDRGLHLFESEGDATSVAIPGLFARVVAVVGDDLVLYEGLPTTGAPQRYSGAFLGWPTRQWTIKVASLVDGSFATVIPFFGFGDVAYCPPR